MSVNGVQGSNLARNTVIAAGVGAAVNGGLSYLEQQKILKDPQSCINEIKSLRDSFINSAKESSKKCNLSKKELKAVIDQYTDAFKGPIEYVENLAKSGKVNWKEVGRSAGFGAAVVAGGYLAYRGVKSLFSKKD